MNFVFFICILIVYLFLHFDKILAEKKNLNDIWAVANIQIKRRFDLLDNIADLFKDIKEKNNVDDTVRARNNYFDSETPEEAMRANKQLTSALKRLFAVANNYPAIETSDVFMRFQEQLFRVEKKIFNHAQAYNSSVKKYNYYVSMFPNRYYSKLLGYRKIKFFNTDESELSLKLED